jgi:hypothetical protein
MLRRSFRLMKWNILAEVLLARLYRLLSYRSLIPFDQLP